MHGLVYWGPGCDVRDSVDLTFLDEAVTMSDLRLIGSTACTSSKRENLLLGGFDQVVAAVVLQYIR